MKKYCILLIIFLVTGILAKAQSRLEMRNAQIVNANSIHIGDTLIFYYTIYNTGNATYSGDINTYLTTNLDTTPMLFALNSVQIDTGINDTFPVQARFAVQPPHFQQNVKSIIVIWPTGTDAKIKGDTFVAKDILIQSKLSIFEQNKNVSYVSFYPNPAKDLLNIKLLKPGVKIEGIKLMDLQGRNLQVNYTDMGQSAIYFDKCSAGVYLLEVTFTNGETSKFKVIKTE